MSKNGKRKKNAGPLDSDSDDSGHNEGNLKESSNSRAGMRNIKSPSNRPATDESLDDYYDEG